MAATVIFDFGNVLAHFDHRRATAAFAAHSPMSEDAMFAAIYGGSLEDDFEAGRLTADQFVDRVVELIGYRGPLDEFASAFVDIFTPNRDVLDLLPRIHRKHRLVLGSNTNELHSAHFREQFAPELKAFSALGLSHQAGVRKPNAGFYEYCASLVQASPTQCIFVDDLESNVAAARAIGMRGIVYRAGTDLAKELQLLDVEVAP